MLKSTGNNGSAVLSSSCTLHFKKNSTSCFSKNTGYFGGAIYLKGYSIIFVEENTSFTFIDNTADVGGGAIYFESSDTTEVSYSYTCFISRNEKNNIHFLFKGNHVGTCNNNKTVDQGNSIFAASLLPCQREYSNNSTNINASIFMNNIANFTFVDEDVNEISTRVSQFRVNNYQDSSEYLFIPGKVTELQIQGLDDFQQETNDIFKVTLKKDCNSTVVSYGYFFISNRILKFSGNPGDKATIMLTATHNNKLTLSFSVELESCPPGYILSQDRECVCSAERYVGIRSCDNVHFQAHRQIGYWLGYLNPGSKPSLVTGYCHRDFCSANNSVAITSIKNISENNIICVRSRRGKLCSECKGNDTVVYYHSPSLKCGNTTLCSLGILFYLLSDILPVTIVFITILSFNIQIYYIPVG